MPRTPCSCIRCLISRKRKDSLECPILPPPQPNMVYNSVESKAKYREYDNAYLGEGSFGVVIHGLTVGTNDSVALKMPSVYCTDAASIQRELEVMKKIRRLGGHCNIIKLIDVAYKKNEDGRRSTVLVLMKCDASLKKWILQNSADIPESIPVREEMSRQLYVGLDFLHNAGIVHGDLHWKNVLVDGYSGLLKITDFGKAHQYTGARLTSEDRVLKQRRDLLAMTLSCTFPLWLLGSAAYGAILKDSKRHFLAQGWFVGYVALAEHYLSERPILISSTKIVRHVDTSEGWTNEISGAPDLGDLIQGMHSWVLSHPKASHGVPVPTHLHSIFLVGCLVGPNHQFNARWMIRQLNAVVSRCGEQQAKELIRMLSVAMRSTTV